MSNSVSHTERIKKGLDEADLEFKGENKEYERLWLEGFGSLSDAINKLPSSKEEFSDDEKFFLLMMEQARQGLYDMYISLRRRRYTAVRRDIRYTYEALLLLDKSVDDPEWASEIQEDFREEAGEMNFESMKLGHSVPETTSKISSMADGLHGVINGEEGAMGELSDLLSVSGSHPYNFESMDLNGKKNLKTEFQYLKYGINFAYGLMGLFIMKFNGDKISDEKFQEMMDIMNKQLKLNNEEMYVFIHYFSDFKEEVDTFQNE
jgi:hypothetical protein